MTYVRQNWVDDGLPGATPLSAARLNVMEAGIEAAHLLSAPTTSSLVQALGILRAGLAARSAAPCRIVFTGSSTTSGSGATTKARRYVDRLVAAIQAAYPAPGGTESAVVDSNTASFGTLSTAGGVHGYNAGEAGTSSGNYLSSAEMSSIGTLSPRMVLHMVGSNDLQAGTNPATTKANIMAKIAALKSAISSPCVHVLVHSYQRMDVTSPTYPWSAYRDAMIEIAAADPANVAFIDASEPFRLSGVPGSDSMGLIADTVHPSDAGHALIADLLREGLGIVQLGAITAAPPAPGDTTAPSVPTGLTATAGNAQVSLSWAASTDNVAVTSYRVRRAGALVASPTGTTYTDTGLTNGTSYGYTVSAMDAAGNESTQSAVASATPAAPTTTLLANDTFDRPDGAGLGVATSGQTWTESPNPAFNISGNRATGAASAFSFLPVGQSDMDVSVQITLGSGSGSTSAGLSLNASNSNNRLAFYLDRAFGGWRFSKVDTGTLTVLTSSAYTLAENVVYTLRCISKGDVLTFSINGVQVGTYTLTAAESTKFKALQMAGLRQGAATSYYFDNFEVRAPA